jgi:hypothetical protein
MSTYVSVNGSPDEVSGVGAQLKAKADAMNASAQGILADIQGKEAGAPWGGDPTGQDFYNKQYHVIPQTEGGGDPAPGTPYADEALKDKLLNAGNDLAKIGNGMIDAMVGYQSADTTSAIDLSKVKDS